MKKIFIGSILFYQKYFSPIKPPTCRFYPTCSHYGLVAVQRFGVVRGGWITIKRLFKCHPFHHGGFDYVPGHESIDQYDHERLPSENRS